MIDQETLFWIYILYPVITGDVQSPNQYFLEQCSKSHKLPNGDAKQISMSTCITKYISYTERGIDGLSRKRRNDIGHPRTITNGILDDILNNVLLNPHLPLKEVCKEVTAKYGIVIPKSTFYGYIRKARIAGLIPKKGNPRSVNNIDLTVVKHKLNEMIVDDLPLRDIYHGIPHLSPNDHGCDMFHENIIVHLNNAWLNGSMHMKKRILSIVLYGYDYNISEIEKIICLSKSTIRRAINSFERHGDVGRAKRTENAAYTQKKNRLIELLHTHPSQYGINRTSWSSESLKKVYKTLYDVEIGKSSICRIIKTTGYSIRKSRRVLTSPDPNYREKVDLLLRALHSLTKTDELFFIDEAGPYRVKKYGGRAYIEKGDQRTVQQNQPAKGSVTFSAALGAQNNQVTWHYHKSKDSKAMIGLIELLFNQYHHLHNIFLSWDAASWHSSNELTEWLDHLNSNTREFLEGPIITLIPLPSNAQFLDVIESVFGGLKKAVINHSDYHSVTEMKTAISTHFAERNAYFKENPKRVGKKIWEIDFFQDYDNLKSGNYRKY